MLIGYLLHFIIVCPILDTLANRLLEFKKTDKSILFFLHYFFTHCLMILPIMY